MGDARSGIAAVVGQAAPLELPAEPVTDDLFDGDPAAGSPVEESSRALRIFQAGSKGEAIAPARRGRPPGSRNRLTADVIRFIDHRYRDPLLGLADIASTPPVKLARLFVPDGQAITEAALARAWDMWRACSFELAEYKHTKQPRVLTVTPESAPLMSFNLFTDQLTMQGGGGAFDQVLGFSESQAKSMQSTPLGEEVLEAEVLDDQKSAGKTNV